MRWLVAGLTVLLGSVFVGSAALGGLLYWNRVELLGEQAARVELKTLAGQQVPAILGYDYQTVERRLIEASTMLTPDFRREVEQRANNEIIPQARERELVSQIDVVNVGVMEARRSSGSVLVYLNRTVTDKETRKSPVYEGVRVRVDYKRLEGKWLINLIAVT